MSRRLVFVDLDEGTVVDCAGGFVIDPDTANLSPGEIDVLDAADSFGSFGPDAAAIVQRAGVSVADLWAAYEWRRAFDCGVADAHLSTGVTYGSPDSPLSVAYDMGRNYGERVADGWRFDESDNAWHHCDRRAYWDDNGVTCSRCQETMPDDVAVES